MFFAYRLADSTISKSSIGCSKERGRYNTWLDFLGETELRRLQLHEEDIWEIGSSWILNEQLLFIESAM